MSDSSIEHEKTTKAVVQIWKLVANLSAGSVIALLLSFFIGGKYEKQYLSGIEAGWAFDLLSFNEVVAGSLSILGPLFSGFLLALNYVYNFENGEKIVAKGERFISGFGFFIYVITVIQGFYFPDEYQLTFYLLRNFAISVMAFAAGFLIVEAIVTFKDQELKINDAIFRSFIYFSITIFLVIPEISRVNAQYDVKFHEERLVRICILSDDCAEYWYIVRHISDKFLILNFEKNGKKNFRLVPISDVTVKP